MQDSVEALAVKSRCQGSRAGWVKAREGEQDSVEAFAVDIRKAGGHTGDELLVQALARGASDALRWLRSKVGPSLPLETVGRMGGHSFSRTYRPAAGLAGNSIMYSLAKQLEDRESAGGMEGAAAAAAAAAKRLPGRLRVFRWSRAVGLIRDPSTGSVVGVEYVSTDPANVVPSAGQSVGQSGGGGGAGGGGAGSSGGLSLSATAAAAAPELGASRAAGRAAERAALRAHHVVLATGGYASDFSEEDSILRWGSSLGSRPFSRAVYQTLPPHRSILLTSPSSGPSSRGISQALHPHRF